MSSKVIVKKTRLEYDKYENFYIDPDSSRMILCGQKVKSLLGRKPQVIYVSLYRGYLPSMGFYVALRKIADDCSLFCSNPLRYSLSTKNKGNIKGKLSYDVFDSLSSTLSELDDGKTHEYTLRLTTR